MRYALIFLLAIVLLCNCRKEKTDNSATNNTTTNNTIDTVPKIDTPITKTLLYIGETVYYSDYHPGSKLPDSITVVYYFNDSTVAFYKKGHNILTDRIRYKHPYPYPYADTLNLGYRPYFIINKDSLTSIDYHTDGMGGITSYTFKGKRQ